MSLSNALAFIGSGDLYLQPVNDDGSYSPMLDVGNTTKFGIKPNSTLKQQISKKRDTYGNPLTSFSLLQPATVTVTIETVNRANLRLAFMGATATYAQTATTVTAEAFVAHLDSWVQLAHEALGPTVTVHKASTPLVENVDYVVNRNMGMIQILSTNTATVADLDPLTVDYAALSFTGAGIRGNVNPQIKTLIVLDGLNKVDNSVGILRVWEAVLSATNEFDWFSDNFNTVQLSGTLNVPTGKTEPFRFYAR